MHQVEIIFEELKAETMKEFERVKIEAVSTANRVKNDTKVRMELVLDILKHNVSELLDRTMDKDYIKEVEGLYKEAIKNIHAAQQASWLLLNDRTIECKRQVKKCFQYACELVEKKDKTLERVYKAVKDFLKSNLKETSKEIKAMSILAQRQIMVSCKDAKRRANKIDF